MQGWRQQSCRYGRSRLPNASTSALTALCVSKAVLSDPCRSASTNAAGALARSQSSSNISKDNEKTSTEAATLVDDNLARVRELLQEASAHHRTSVLPDPRLPRYREVWPAPTFSPLPKKEPVSSSSLPSAPASQYNSVIALQSVRQRPQATDGGGGVDTRGTSDPLCWYGAPPGVVRNVEYFTSTMAAQWNKFFRQQYYLLNRPTAPLLRCPACATHLLRSGGDDAAAAALLSQSARSPASSRLWLDPPTLDRHLSWAHADQLYTTQELAPYNDQVLHELMQSCGLASTQSGRGARRDGAGAERHRETPARLVLAVDAANTEIGSTSTLMDMLTSNDLRRMFTQVPVAFCATHELFVPFSSKVLHTLYQLALLHPSSTLHIFVANTSLESGDVMMFAYLNEMMLASPTRDVPPVVMITRDGQQRQVAKEMRGVGQRTLSPVGVVRCSPNVTLNSLVQEVRAALFGSLWSV